MNYLPLLTEDEAQYICSVIPYQDTVNYFKHNPKQFAQIRPGFRATSISKADASKLLFNNRSRKFISFFIEKNISNWISQIHEHFAKCIEDGDSREIALIHTLPFSFFANNVGLYFKLVNEEYSEEYITLMSAIVTTIKEATKKQEEQTESIKLLESEGKRLQENLDKLKVDLRKNKDTLSDAWLEIDVLKEKVTTLERLQVTPKKNQEEIKILKLENKELFDILRELSSEITEIKNNSQIVEGNIISELRKPKKRFDEVQCSAVPSPKCPSDIDEFKEYLGYNLTNIGLSASADYFPLIISYLSKILFQGIPIVMNHAIGVNLIKCIANTLTGRSTINILLYNEDLTVEEINQFLLMSDRVVCLDNFIGNYNETELISLMKMHRDKIIFLTVIYDRTMRYVPIEFLRYCHYFNANRIGELSVDASLTEDPSTIVEHSYIPKSMQGENRFRNIFREILRELNYPQSIIEHNCYSISNEQDLCQTLAFNILPYCLDVMQIQPYNTSERLLKYTSGRCNYRNLLERWFAQ